MKQKQDMASASPAWLDSIIAQYKPSKSFFMNAGMFFLTGLFTGLFFRSYGRAALIFLVGLFCFLFVLDYSSMVTIHYSRLALSLGIDRANSLFDIAHYYTNWAQSNLFLCLSFFIGFLLGWRIG